MISTRMVRILSKLILTKAIAIQAIQVVGLYIHKHYTFNLYPGPDNTVDDLDFSLFQSHEDILYDVLGDLSFDEDDIAIDVSDCKELEERCIARFAQEGCKCKHANGKPCCSLFSIDHYHGVRDECRQLSSSELDLVVMGQLLALTQRDDVTQAQHHSPKERKRSFTCFKHGGHDICIKTFCFLHTISRSKFEAIKASFLSNGLSPRKRPYVKPRHALRFADIEYVVAFVRNYAEDNAVLLPGRIPGYKRDDIVLLPSSTTKRAVWQLYQSAAENAPDVKAVGYSSFCSLWNQLLPNILVCKPMSDLCWTCQQNSARIMKAHNRPEEEKSEVSVSKFLFNAHLFILSLTFPSFSPLSPLPAPPPSLSLPPSLPTILSLLSLPSLFPPILSLSLPPLSLFLTVSACAHLTSLGLAEGRGASTASNSGALQLQSCS